MKVIKENMNYFKLTLCRRIFSLILILLPAFILEAQDRTIAGKAVSPYPTLQNLGIEWFIKGDENLNGKAVIKYREKSGGKWTEGMPLFRVPAGENVNFSWKNKYAGSIFNLKPDTEYEISLTLTDPDGGDDSRTISARTRPVPVVMKTAEIVDIAPGKYDTLYTRNGTKEKPVVYRCTKGEATFGYVDLNNREWVFIEGLHVKNLREEGKGIQLNGAKNCIVRHCNINAVYGIVAYLPGAENCYISDNTVTGTCEWINEAMGAHGENIGEGIEMTGPGNVICYNRVTAFRDCISTMEDEHVYEQTCIDIYNNDIYTGVDDAIEADFCFSNCRIYRNRITNSFVGLSSQPGLGGPNYFIRNAMYNVIHAAFKLKRFSQGDVILHNTVVKVGTGLGGNDTMDYAYFRNNLAIGGPTGGVNWGDYGAGNPFAADIISPGSHSDFDYDAVGVSGTEYVAKIGGRAFSSVEKHGTGHIRLEDTFPGVVFPNPPVPEREAPDLRPAPGSLVIDAGVHIPGINDDYKGKAPDCGAYEAGQQLPHYGPRTGSQE